MKKIIISCIILCFSYGSLFAIDSRVESAFAGFMKSIESQYSPDQKETVLLWLRDKLNNFKYDEKYKNLTAVINDLSSLTYEVLYDIWLESELSQTTQQIIELKERKAFGVSIQESDISTLVQGLLGSSRTFIETNSDREFVESGNILRVWYSSYFPVNSGTVIALKQKDWIIVFDQDSQEYRFIESYTFDKKIPYSQMSSLFSHYLTANHKVQEISGIYHSYNFIHYSFYHDSYGAYQSQLDASGFEYNSTLLYYNDDGSYNFVTDYETYPIINTQDIFGVPQKQLFLDYLREDSKYQSTDISSELMRLKNISDSLTSWVSHQQWIKNIYNWILNNVEYSQNIDLTDQKIFSWIETFKNKSWVCTWYTKLSSYLFYFAGYYDVEVIRGHVIDAEDFPQIGHAWLRIWDLYYDPTFDDPIWAQNTKTIDQYKYFGLPKDIFYANRFEYWDLPESFKTATKSQINQHIFNTLSNLIPKYKTTLHEYPVFAQINFKNTYNISAETSITPDILASNLWSYSVEDNSFIFQQNGETKQITHIRYYTLTNNNTESVLDILWYDTGDMTLFDWQLDDWQREWRLWYELELR